MSEEEEQRKFAEGKAERVRDELRRAKRDQFAEVSVASYEFTDGHTQDNVVLLKWNVAPLSSVPTYVMQTADIVMVGEKIVKNRYDAVR